MILCTIGNIFFCLLFSLFVSDRCLLVKLTLEIYVSKISSGYPLFFERILNIWTFLSKVEREKVVLRKRGACLVTNPFFTPKAECRVVRLYVKGRFPINLSPFHSFNLCPRR